MQCQIKPAPPQRQARLLTQCAIPGTPTFKGTSLDLSNLHAFSKQSPRILN